MKDTPNCITVGFTTVIINDCRDTANAEKRQQTRFSAELMGLGILSPITFVGVQHDFEAAFNLVDQLDAIGEHHGCISVNVAHRDGAEHRHGNGTEFCCFQYKRIWVLSTLSGSTLSLVKKLRLTTSVFVIHLGDAVKRIMENGFITAASASEIPDSQFRSFDFSPRALAYVLSGRKLCCTEVPIENIIPDSHPIIAVIDCFGNGKTTVLAKELRVEQGQVQTIFGPLPFFKRLADAPDGVVAIIQGSSGLPGNRFAEIVVNGDSAANQLGFNAGDRIFS